MGLRFRKRIRLFPGMHLNLSLSGASVTLGPRGASANLGRRGTNVTVGVPGTGLSYHTKLRGRASSREPEAPARSEETTGGLLGNTAGSLTPPHLTELRAVLIELGGRRVQLSELLADATRALQEALDRRRRAERSILAFLHRQYARDLAGYEEASRQLVHDLEAARDATAVDVDSCLPASVSDEFSRLSDAFEAMARRGTIWDITREDESGSGSHTRAQASSIEREKVTFTRRGEGALRSTIPGLHLVNANGPQIVVHPGFAILYDDDALCDVLDLTQVTLTDEPVDFAESRPLPDGALVIATTWERVKKDGSPDRRYKNNREVAVTAYHRIDLTSPLGLREAWLLSARDTARTFAEAFRALQASIPVGSLADAADDEDIEELQDFDPPTIPAMPAAPLASRALPWALLAASVVLVIGLAGQFGARPPQTASTPPPVQATPLPSSNADGPGQTVSEVAAEESAVTPASPVPPRALRAGEVKEAQRLLSRVGFPPGKPDGRLGRQTVEAIRGFQRSAERAPTGLADLELLDVLAARVLSETP